jgi:hypothetical protein
MREKIPGPEVTPGATRVRLREWTFSLFLEEVRCCGKGLKQRGFDNSTTSCYVFIITRNESLRLGGEGADGQQFWCHPTEARVNPGFQ